MNKILLIVSVLFGLIWANSAFATDEPMLMGSHHHDMSMMDLRTSLGVTGEMKLHQLSNMRGHVEAIKTIVGLMAEGNFEDASIVAHNQLGLTPEMQGMCSMFNNAKFEKLGLAFHKSGDELGDTLKSKDVNASLRALNNTMQYCVECHANFKQ